MATVNHLLGENSHIILATARMYSTKGRIGRVHAAVSWRGEFHGVSGIIGKQYGFIIGYSGHPVQDLLYI